MTNRSRSVPPFTHDLGLCAAFGPSLSLVVCASGRRSSRPALQRTELPLKDMMLHHTSGLMGHCTSVNALTASQSRIDLPSIFIPSSSAHLHSCCDPRLSDQAVTLDQRTANHPALCDARYGRTMSVGRPCVSLYVCVTERSYLLLNRRVSRLDSSSRGKAAVVCSRTTARVLRSSTSEGAATRYGRYPAMYW